MKRIIFLIVIGSFVNILTAQNDQEFVPSGKIEGKIFTNFNDNILDSDGAKAFELKRAYFGYQYKFAPYFKAKLKIDVGGAEFITTQVENQYVFFKTAAVYYDKDQWSLAFGLHDTYQFKVQEKLWGKRYILPAMLDIQKFNFSADIGFSAAYNLENFTFDLSLFNGEGYKQFQEEDNTFRSSLGITSYLADKKVILRGYTDWSSFNVHLSSFTGFAGLDLKKFSLGAEYTFQKNYLYNENQDRTGFSAFSQYDFTDRFGLWARVDILESDYSDPTEPLSQQYFGKDGSFIYSGFEYVVVPNHLTSSLNYQHHIQDDPDLEDTGFVYLNLEIKF